MAMAKKKVKGRRQGDYYGEDERYWKGWGQRFGERVRDWGEGFADEMHGFGERAGKRMDTKMAYWRERREERKKQREERRAREAEWAHPGRWNWHWNSWWFWPFALLGLLGPLIGSVIWVIMIIVGLWVLRAANFVLMSGFISLLISAVSANLQWFFAVSLFLGYCDFAMRRAAGAFWFIWPVSNAVSFTFSVWIVAWVFRVIGSSAGAGALAGIGVFLRQNLLPVFLLVLALGYLLLGVRRMSWGHRYG